MLMGGHPVAQLGGYRLEVARASKLLGAEAVGHLACDLRDVTLLGRLDEDSLHAERLQFRSSGSAASRSGATLDTSQHYGSAAPHRWVGRYGCSLGQCSGMSPRSCATDSGAG